MLNNLLPSTKKDNLKLQEELKKLTEENKILKTKICDIENNILDYLKKSDEDIVKNLSNKIENYDSENSKKFQKLNEEIFSIVSIINKSMFLEIVNNHKDSLDKVFKTYEK